MTRPLLLALALAASAQAQADLFGVVADAESDGPVVGASVVLTDGAGRVSGRATGTEGEFVFRGLAAGTYVLRVQSLGYAAFVDTLALAAGDRRDLAVRLAPRAETLGAVEVEAPEAPVVREPGLDRLRPADLRALPATDPGGDLAGALLVRGGVSTAGDTGGQLSVRGGTPTQNLVLVDGIPIFQPFHLFGAYSALPAGVVRSADFYTGGWPARFGGRIASVVDVVGRTGHKRRPRGAATVSPFVTGVELEVPLVPGDVSVLASARESVVRETAEAFGASLPFRFGDRYLKAHARLDATSSLQGTLLQSVDTGDLGDNGDRLTQRSTAAGAQFFSISSAFAAAIDVAAYWSRYETTFEPVSEPRRSADLTNFGGRFGYVYYIGPHTVRTGIQASSYFFEYAFRPEAETRENTSEGSFFVDADLELGRGVRLEPGVRFQTFPSQSRPGSFEPRLLASWAVGEHVFRGAVGVHRQEIVGLTDQRDVGDVFTAWTASSDALPVPTATHAVLGWEGPAASGLRVGVEGYAKALSGQTILFDGRLRSTNGEALGADVTAELRRPGVRLDVLYGLASLVYRDAERTYRPPFHRPQRLAVSGRVERGPWAASAAFQLTSGRPVSRVSGTFRDLTRDRDVETAGGVPVALFEPEPYAGRTPVYYRLDLGVERAVRLPFGRAVFQASVVNVTDRDNVFYYDALRAQRVDQLPLLPSLGLRVEVE